MSFQFIRYLMCACAISLGCTTALGLGFRLVDQDAKATARGEAFAATADNPSAIYYNPAGITQIDGLSARLGAYAISIETDVTLRDGQTFESSDDVQGVPQFYVTWKPRNHPVAIGFGVYAPYGLSVEYPDDTPFRSIAKRGEITFLTFNPVIALQVTRSLSVAVGATVNYAKTELERGIRAKGDRFLFEGSGEAYGFTAGALWKPLPQHSFGLTYHSATKINFSGHTSIKVDAFTVATPLGPFPVAEIDSEEDSNARVHFPQFVILGYSYRPTPDWNLEVNVDWTDWDQLNTVNLQNQVIGDVPLPFNYTSSFLYEAGVTRSFSRGLYASAGYIFSENSIPESQFNPIVPDQDRHVVSVGVGQKTDHWEWDLAYQCAFANEDRRIRNNTPADGEYNTTAHALTLSVGYRY